MIGSDEAGTLMREVSMRSQEPIRIERIRCSDPAVRFSLSSSTDSRLHTFRIELPDVQDGVALSAELTIQVRKETDTNAREARTVSVPIHRLPRTKKGY